MRKWVLGIGLAAIIAAPAMAAAQSAFGVRAGARWSDLDNGHDSSSMSSLVVGGYYGFGISNRLAIQLEAVYGSRGAESLRVGASELEEDADRVDLDMNYIEVPVLLRAGFPGERFLPSFFVGPYVGFLLDCELQPVGGDSRECDAEGAAPRFDPRGTDYGVVLGGALDMTMGQSTIFVDARFTLGLLPVQSGDGAFDARHSGLAVSAGFAMPVGR